MTREEALKSLSTLVKNNNLKRHHLACGACMKEIALHLKTKHKPTINLFGLGAKTAIDENSWEVVGLLHDADYERTKDRPVEHGPIVLDEIRSLGYTLTAEETEAIKFHNFENTHAKESLMGWAIYICEQATGLIIASAQAGQDKRLASLTESSLLEKMKDESFAKSVDRKKINLSKEKLGIDTEELIKVCLKAMSEISQELNL